MRMTTHDASYIQSDMYILAIDDTSNCPLMIYGGSGDGRRKEEDIFEWMRAVNIIYRCLCCGLWTVEESAPYMRDWLDFYGLRENYALCKRLSEYSPFVPEEINMRYWMEPLLCNTDFGQSFVEGFGIDNLKDKVYPPFIEALEELFRKNGVPWEAGDLFDMRSRLG